MERERERERDEKEKKIICSLVNVCVPFILAKGKTLVHEVDTLCSIYFLLLFLLPFALLFGSILFFILFSIEQQVNTCVSGGIGFGWAVHFNTFLKCMNVQVNRQICNMCECKCVLLKFDC